jgi:hypothetical protein
LFLVICAAPVPRNPKSHAAVLVFNDCHCCAERRLIKQMLEESRKKGVPIYKFPQWLHRKYGDLVVWRPRKDGVLGVSLPCVLCRKELEKYQVQWMAFTGDRWVHSKKDQMPKSVPTNKQRRWFNFLG